MITSKDFMKDIAEAVVEVEKDILG